MDARRRRPADDDRERHRGALPREEPARYEVRISEPGEIAAALPHLLGFRPSESLVLISLTGTGGRRVGLTVRADIPPAPHAAPVARSLARSVATDDPRAVLVAVVSETADPTVPSIRPDHGSSAGAGERATDLPHRLLVHEVVRALAAVGIPVRGALLVRTGRWWSYDCPRACCAPARGTPLPSGISELEVASVATGQVTRSSRDDLAAVLSPPGERAAAAMAAVRRRVAADCSARVLELGPQAVAAESWAAVTAALARCRPGAPSGGDPMSDGEVARVVWGLRDGAVRDRALELALGNDAAAAEVLWTECTRRSASPMDAAPATLLAISAWLRGDGAMANVALERALAGEPGYALARLLAQALAACLGPAELRALIVAAVPRPAGPPRPG